MEAAQEKIKQLEADLETAQQKIKQLEKTNPNVRDKIDEMSAEVTDDNPYRSAAAS